MGVEFPRMRCAVIHHQEMPDQSGADRLREKSPFLILETAMSVRDFSKSMLVTLCTYNEIENLTSMLAEIHRQVAQSDILVIDDNSPDGTGKLADSVAASGSRVHVLHRERKLGVGSAIVTGMRYAIDHGYEYVVNLDADFSHHPRYIPAMLNLMASADVVIGSRYIPGGKVVGWGMSRHLMSKGINWYARGLLGLSPRDTSGGYRCYRVANLRELNLDLIRSRGYSFQEEILYRCRRIRCRFAELPITFEDRRLGKSKINLGEVASALWVILRLGIENFTGKSVVD